MRESHSCISVRSPAENGSTGNVIVSVNDQEVLDEIPSVGQADPRNIIGNDAARYGYKRWVLDSYQVNSREPRAFLFYSSQSVSPQVAAVLLAKAFYKTMVPEVRFKWPAALYFARLGNLFAFTLLGSLAIRSLPQFRSLAAGVLLLPMMVHLASSCSYDITPFLASLWLLTTVVVARRQPELLTRGQIIVLGLMAFVLGHAKVVYAPLLLVVFALRRKMLWQRFFLLCLCLSVLALTGVVSGSLFFGPPETSSNLVQDQFHYLLSNPGFIPRLLFDSLAHFKEFYFVSFLGNPGWLDTTFVFPSLVFLWMVLLLSIFVDGLQGAPGFDWLDCLAILCGAALSIVAIMLALYMSWTKGVGAKLIDGVQGRYFIPVFLVASPVFARLPRAIYARVGWLRPHMIEFQIVVQATFLCLTVLVILARYRFS